MLFSCVRKSSRTAISENIQNTSSTNLNGTLFGDGGKHQKLSPTTTVFACYHLGFYDGGGFEIVSVQ